MNTTKENGNKTAKVRFDYTTIGLVKNADNNDEVTFDGLGINELPKESIDWIANYGLFVYLTRSLAGHEKESVEFKRTMISDGYNWLKDGMPKKTRANSIKTDSFIDSVNSIINGDVPMKVMGF